LPIYFTVLSRVSPDIILAQRILWSVPTGLVLIALASRWRELKDVFQDRIRLGWLALSGALMGVNWLIYIWAVHQGRVMEGSLGYFINPLFSFVLAALFFGERFSKLQVIAIILACAGVLNQTLNVGQFPWVAISLCVTFGFYGAIRKKVIVDGRTGFFVEVLLIAPFALAYQAYAWSNGAPLMAERLSDSLLLSLAGIITAVPLILFALAAKRLRLSTIAIMQFLGPTLQFIVALYYGEAFTQDHAITFVCIWLGVAVFSFGAWKKDKRAGQVAHA
jgi:chloramphenicol-sensitive protein RarD